MSNHTNHNSDKRIWEYKQKTQKALLLRTLIDTYYETEITGGNCHIVLDDGNFKKHHIEFCLKKSKENNDYFGQKIMELCLEFTEQELDVITCYDYDLIDRFENNQYYPDQIKSSEVYDISNKITSCIIHNPAILSDNEWIVEINIVNDSTYEFMSDSKEDVLSKIKQFIKNKGV